jgi:hypothetical protein
MKKALATFVIGDEFKEFYKRFRESHVRYCERFNWELIEMTEPIIEVKCRKDIGTQKILVGTFEDYDTVVWIDSDVWITDNCPEIETRDPTKIGVTLEAPFGSLDVYDLVKKRRQWGTVKEYYELYGYTEPGLPNLNSGFIVFHPKVHAEYVRKIQNEMLEFAKGIPEIDKNGNHMHNDQPFLGTRLMKDDMYEVLDWRHNCIWPVYRCLLAEPYVNQIELVRPIKTLMGFAYSLHFTDREDIDVLEFVKNMESKDLVLSQDDIDKGILFDPIFRLHEHNIKVPEGTQLKFPRNQYGFVNPKNISVIQ